MEHRVLSLDVPLFPRGSLRVEAWQKLYSRLVPRWENLFDPIESVPELQGDRVRVAPESADARGLELLARYDAGPLGLYLAWTLSRARESLAGVDTPRSWDQTNALNASVVWRPSARTSLGASFVWHTGWPYTDVLLDGTTPVLGPRNAVRFATYSRLDARLSHRFPLGRTSLRAYVEVMNVLDRRNDCCIDSIRLRKPFGAHPYLEKHFGTLIGRIPSFGVEWEF